MDRANILSGSAFRTAIHAALAVVVTLAATSIGAFLLVQQTLEREMQRQIMAEQLMLSEIHDKGGLAELLRTISELDNPVALSHRAIGAFAQNGLKLAGNIEAAPDIYAFARVELTLAGTKGMPRPYYAHTTLLDKTILVIGHDLTLIAAAERRLLFALIGSGLITAAVILLIGYMASRKSLRKLNNLESTLDHISQGDTDIRVPVTGENDQIDRISRRVNTHLDRLSRLMVTTKSTTLAIAHDLKTPLSRAQLSLQLAVAQLEKNQDPTETIGRIEAELDRLNRIFDTILRISRIETSTKHAEFRKFQLQPMLQDLVETFAPMAEECGQSLSLSTSAGPLAAALGDERMVRQMIVNLIQNAINHGPPGNAINISLHDRGGACTVEIADHGPGIPEDQRLKVFDPFYRLDGSRTGDGSGLGLALVKAIAERHDIEITLADNAPGLKVTLILPPGE